MAATPHHGALLHSRTLGGTMKKSSLLLAALAGFVALGAQAECVYPAAPSQLPDGKTATEPEMVEGMKAVKAYDKAVNDYLACLDTEKQAKLDSMGADAPKEQIQQINAIHSKKYNAAVQELEQRAANFNEQVRAFKGRNKS
jgi:hypothetical protein